MKKYLNIPISVESHGNVKIISMRRGITVSQAGLEAIEQWLNQPANQALWKSVAPGAGGSSRSGSSGVEESDNVKLQRKMRAHGIGEPAIRTEATAAAERAWRAAAEIAPPLITGVGLTSDEPALLSPLDDSEEMIF